MMVYFILPFQVTVTKGEVNAGTQVRNLEAETETEVLEECCLPACSLDLTFLIQRRPSLGMVLPTMG